MYKFFQKKRPLSIYLIIPLFILIFFEAVILILFFNYGSIKEYLCYKTVASFEDKLSLQSTALQKKMLNKWGNIEDSANLIDLKINRSLNNNEELINNFLEKPMDNPELMQDISSTVFNTIDNNSVTGAFLVFHNSSAEGSAYPIIHYKDINSLKNNGSNSKIVFVNGSKYIGENQSLTFDKNWTEAISFEALESTDFYFKPFNAAENLLIKGKQPDLTDLGYWSKPFKLNNEKVITYTIPLVNKLTNELYGVYGIEISLDSIEKLFQNEASEYENYIDYVISYSNNMGESFIPCLSIGSNFEELLSANNEINTIETKTSKFNIVKNNLTDKNDITSKEKNKILCSSHNLELYSPASPFSDEQWYLMALTYEKSLYSLPFLVSKSLFSALFLFLAISIIGILLISFNFTMPIKLFVQRAKNLDPTTPVKLDKTNVTELDELSDAIEVLSTNIINNSAKLSQILSLANLSIGAFEYDPMSSKVFCTDVMIKFLSLHKNDYELGYISKELFLDKLSVIITDLTPKINKVYELKANNRVSWVKVKTMDNNGKILGIVMDVTNETAEKRRIEHERDHDSLTHLYNRGAFLSLLNEKINDKSLSSIGALIMCDLDNLKKLNDTYGHDFGDKYIRAAADALSFFNQYNGIVARMSGDEFYAFIDGFKTKEECRKVISKFTALFKTAYIHIDRETVVHLKASFGIAWYPEDSDNPTALLKYADFAMNEVKNNAKNDYNEFNLDSYINSTELVKAKNDLIKLIHENHFKYAFQPIISAKTGEVFAYESLMRPSLPSLKSPLEVLELATLQNRLRDIEKLTWLNSLDFYAKNQEKFGNAKIFINSIPNQLLDPSELDYIDTVYGKIFPNVVLEVIESEKGEEEIIKGKRERIQKMGGLIALDDFGSGYSNSLALLTITPDLIKMDMDLIRNIDIDIDKQALVQNTIAYANERDIKIVAEGIETEDELRTVIKLGVDYLQGYFLCKPDFDVVKPSMDKINTILRLNKELEDNI